MLTAIIFAALAGLVASQSIDFDYVKVSFSPYNQFHQTEKYRLPLQLQVARRLLL